MPNLENIPHNYLFHHIKKIENIFFQKFGFYFSSYFFADPAFRLLQYTKNYSM
jgi:hypothetical protein